MKAFKTVFLLTATHNSRAAAHVLREGAALDLNLIPCRLGAASTNKPEGGGKSGIIHLDSAWHLVEQREHALQELCEWVQLAPRHAFQLPSSLRKLTAEAQDSLGRDLSMLASCREGDFLIVAALELEKEPIMASLKLWLAPQVPIVFHGAPSCEKSAEEPLPSPDLVRWFL